MWHKSAEMNVSEKALFKKSKIIEIDQVFIFLEQFLFFDFEILCGPDRLIVLINHYNYNSLLEMPDDPCRYNILTYT